MNSFVNPKVVNWYGNSQGSNFSHNLHLGHSKYYWKGIAEKKNSEKFPHHVINYSVP